MKDVTRSFGTIIMEARKRKGLTQDGLRKALKIKDISFVTLVETSRHIPTPCSVLRLAKALDIDCVVLLNHAHEAYLQSSIRRCELRMNVQLERARDSAQAYLDVALRLIPGNTATSC